jgi:hypothetical protein
MRDHDAMHRSETPRLTRRSGVAAALGLLAAGCAAPASIPGPFDALRLAVQGPSGPPITREQVERLPYASLRARFGRGPSSLLVLGRYAGEELHWISADRSVIATRAGRVVRTVGFPQDLKATRGVGEDPLARGLHRLGDRAEYVRLVDLEPGDRFQVPVRSVLRVEGESEIEALGQTRRALHVVEEGEAPQLGWRFVNHYWADPGTGFVWESVQSTAPGQPPVRIEVLKPAAPRGG